MRRGTSRALIVTGTDTGVGKTVVAAGLVQALEGVYWKPVQSGLEDETDSDTVRRLSGRPVLPETHRLSLPASPHLSAEREGVHISPDALAMPVVDGPLVIEGAGGVLVPLNRECLFVEAFRRWAAPVVLVARTGLGTINHTLLSLEALRARECRVAGVIFSGPTNPDNVATIAAMGRVRSLGRVPPLAPLNPETLAAAFSGIDLEPVREAMAC